MENCSICNLYYKKSLKSDHIKSVKHLGASVKKKWGNIIEKMYFFMPRSDKNSHLNSNKNKNNKVWFEECSKYVSDTTRHFQGDIHLRNKQNNQLNQLNNFNLDTQQSCPSVQSASSTQQSSVQSASGIQHPSVQFDNKC